MKAAGAGALIGLLLAPVQGAAQSTPLLNRLDEIGTAVGACWEPPAALAAFETIVVTVRFALRVDGSLIGPPRVSLAGLPADMPRLREILTRSAVRAVEACTPLPISAGLGRAIAGRIFAVRFNFKGPRGQGA